MSRNRTRSLALVGALVMAVGLSGCAGGMGKPDISVQLQDTKMVVDPPTAKEGPVRFDVDNTGTQNLELRIFRTDDPSKLVVSPDGVLDVTKPSVADTLKSFTPGRYRMHSPNLPPGTYLLVGTPVTQGPDGKTIARFQPNMVTKLTITKYGE